MCLDTKQTVPMVADEDITVYKMLEYVDHLSDYRTPYRGMSVLFGKEYQSGLVYFPDEESPDGGVVERGLHSYAEVPVNATQLGAWEEANIFLFEAIIPKGAQYYKGRFGNASAYASDRLIVTKKRVLL